jgi:hypothetical protein
MSRDAARDELAGFGWSSIDRKHEEKLWHHRVAAKSPLPSRIARRDRMSPLNGCPCHWCLVYHLASPEG